MRRTIIIVFFLALAGFSANAQDVKVTSAFDSISILVGDQIGYTVTVDQPVNLKLELPFFKDSLNKHIEIVSGPVIDSAVTGDRLKIISKYIVTSFDSGRYQLSPVFAEKREDNNIKRYYSDYAFLRVNRIAIAPADTTMKIFDIVKPYRAPLTAGEVLPWLFLLILIAGIVFMSVRYFRKHWKKRPESEILIDPDPAHVIAFRELEQLRNEELWQKGDIKGFYTRLTEILRKYLENRYRVFSLELTTSETLSELLKTGFKKDSTFTLLKEVLTGADLVKFAKYNPDAVENDTHFQNAWRFVEITLLQSQNTNEQASDNQEKEVSV